MFFSCEYAILALPIRAFTSASNSPCSSMMLSRYIKVFTFSKSSPSSVIRLLHVMLYRRILHFPLCMLRPTAVEAAATFVVASVIKEPDHLRSLDRPVASQLSTVSYAPPQVLTSS
ncbi:unnamed protein product [Schistosoma mattheei]|uniref:Uncharacterized protein n=1 Tax=Schistosoma mattheei TaxID=31246 RepID=A0A183Q1B9_9TREM|nr:unnamed protein product [Schistosoma mattheei]